MKLNHKKQHRTSFIMAVPIMLAASGLSLLKNIIKIFRLLIYLFYILGFLAAFTVGLIAIKTFLHLINKIKLIPFCHFTNCISNLSCYTLLRIWHW